MSRQAGARHWFGSGSFAVQRGAVSNLETIRNSLLYRPRPSTGGRAPEIRSNINVRPSNKRGRTPACAPRSLPNIGVGMGPDHEVSSNL